MTARASHGLMLCLLASCAGGEGAKGIQIGAPLDINGDGKDDGLATDRDGDGVADSIDLDGDGTPDALLPWLTPDPPSDGGASGNGDGDASVGDGDGDDIEPGDGDGNGDGGPPDDGDALPTVDVPLGKVPCGASECEIREDNVCCDRWHISNGFENSHMCITENECLKMAPPVFLASVRAVTSTCDGSGDCYGGHVCCYVRQGSPVDFAGTQPGAGRQCMTFEDCSAEASANGFPTGQISCNDDGDCQTAPGTTCQAEQDNSATTGTNTKARAGFKVCR